MLTLLLVLVCFVLPGLICLPLVLGPFFVELEGRKPRYGFSTADLLWLMAVVQYPLVISVLLGIGRDRSYQYEARMVFAVVLCLVFVVLWLRGVAMLNALGVCNTWKRGAFLVVLLPLVGLLALSVVPGVSVALSSPIPPAAAAGVFLGIAALIYGLRLLGLWVLSGRVEAFPAPERPRPLENH